MVTSDLALVRFALAWVRFADLALVLFADLALVRLVCFITCPPPEIDPPRSPQDNGDRTQPGLPMKPGRTGTMTHDYKRHGTTTLFAALNVLDGTIIGRNMKHHRHQEFDPPLLSLPN
jgi:hypothetical protein